jgi:hypothetical protein
VGDADSLTPAQVDELAGQWRGGRDPSRGQG